MLFRDYRLAEKRQHLNQVQGHTMGFWTGLTQPQVTLILGFLNSIVVPLILFLWGRFRFNRLNEELADTQKEAKQTAGELADNEAPPAPEPVPTWNNLRDEWTRVRQKLMDVAFDPNIDGRTRAAYGRIDLRGGGYGELIRRLETAGRLGDKTATYKSASDLWNSYRNNRRNIPADAIQKMKNYADSL